MNPPSLSKLKGTCQGRFWILDRPEEKFFGLLKIKEFDDAVFSTIDHIDRISQIETTISDSNPLCGLVESEESGEIYCIYILKVVYLDQRNSALSKYVYRITKGIMSMNGSNYHTKFKYLMISSNVIQNWISKTGIKIKNNPSSSGFGGSFMYEQPDKIVLFENTETRIEVYFRANQTYGNKGKSFSVVEQPFINVKFHQEATLDEMNEYRRKIEWLLMIIWKEYHLTSQFQIQDSSTFSYIILGYKPPWKNIDWNIKGFDQFQTKSQFIFEKWFDEIEEYDLSLKTFFFAYSDYKMDVFGTFLNITFALEHLHSKLIRKEEPLSKTNEKMFKKALDETKGDVKSWLKSVLNKNRPIQLKVRIQELQKFCSQESGKKLSIFELKRIQDNRHYLIHLDKKHENSKYSGSEINSVNDRLIELYFEVFQKIIGYRPT